MEVTCAMMDDFMTLFFGPVAHLMPYWGIFRFGGSLWIFAEVTCSRIGDSMLSDFRPIIHFDATHGHISVRMRFTDHEGVACLSLFGMDDLSSSDFLAYYILDATLGHIPHFDRDYRSPLVYMIIHGYEIHARSMFDFILSGYSEEPLLSHSARFIPFDIVVIPGWSPLSGASFETRRVLFSHFQQIEICSGMPYLEPSLSLFSSAFKAIIGFQIDIQSRFSVRHSESSSSLLGFGVQSHHRFSVSAFRAITIFSSDPDLAQSPNQSITVSARGGQ
ncbi:hypothetical protein CK203_079195 [Vitis vinifera]|uniref:Uncharacterized protein n=1 Tax=Vitis vinifera TaxID=29760 RepID=A0A438DYP8_VITVI|nr:hypothetical protein CK203_079195 [Vitis vinifera]